MFRDGHFEETASGSKEAVAEFTGEIHGHVRFIYSEKSRSTRIKVDVEGLQDGQKYNYHIHEKPVTNNDCSTTGEHFNPTKAPYPQERGKYFESYEVGDVSGKFGPMVPENGGKFRNWEPYYDPTMTVGEEGSNRDILGRSVVIHASSSIDRAPNDTIFGVTRHFANSN